jgi:predicted RNA-binding protein (virulence factor B family)
VQCGVSLSLSALELFRQAAAAAAAEECKNTQQDELTVGSKIEKRGIIVCANDIKFVIRRSNETESKYKLGDHAQSRRPANRPKFDSSS